MRPPRAICCIVCEVIPSRKYGDENRPTSIRAGLPSRLRRRSHQTEAVGPVAEDGECELAVAVVAIGVVVVSWLGVALVGDERTAEDGGDDERSLHSVVASSSSEFDEDRSTTLVSCRA